MGVERAKRMGTAAGVVLAAALLAAAGCASDPAPQPTPTSGTPVPTAEDYRIGPEDLLQITVWRNDNLSREVTVRPDGKISMPLLNDVQAAGLTAVELRNEIARGLKEYVTAPDVTVTVKEIKSLRINVLGQVNKPGVLDLKRRVTVLDAISMAGGLTPFAAANKVVVIRKQPDGRTLRIGVRYKDLIGGDDRQNILLQRDDTILVPQSLF
jgi:polysaccharide export outer membrane protein